MTDHQPLLPTDVGRVYVHGTTVRVVLINHLGDEPFQVTVKCMEPTDDGRYIVTQIDSRNLVATDEWIFPNVTLTLSSVQAALLHSIVRESGWHYTEARGNKHTAIAQDLLALANLITVARTEAGALDVKRPDHHKMLFDAQFEGVSDRVTILGANK
jgi:hypothetical protein